MIRKGSRYPRRISKAGREVHWLTKGGRTIYMSPATARTVGKIWLFENVDTTCVVVDDSAGRWFELEIILPGDFTGNPVDGWTGEMVAGKPPISLTLQWSQNLTGWTAGGWIAAPGKTTETLGDGRKKWFARYQSKPLIYNSALIDLRITSARHGKSITGLSLLGSALSLPSFPYAMPSQAATLQTHLRAAGLTGATVTSATGAWRAEIRDNNVSSTGFRAVWSGADITEVRTLSGNVLVTLPNYPYTMPADESALEADLLAAGYDYPQVTLHKDEWQIFLPDIQTTGTERGFDATITPADPVQLWTFYGTPNGTNPQTLLSRTIENIRVTGSAASEAICAFGRVVLTPV